MNNLFVPQDQHVRRRIKEALEEHSCVEAGRGRLEAGFGAGCSAQRTPCCRHCRYAPLGGTKILTTFSGLLSLSPRAMQRCALRR